jgi:hypothetical protein
MQATVKCSDSRIRIAVWVMQYKGPCYYFRLEWGERGVESDVTEAANGCVGMGCVRVSCAKRTR